ncbi:3-phosphoshikimate 1-carboxyvinyltransferase, partial [Candidatus Bipolaricaulota bacterium]|nr:3-phosphoshikimate 1-carboxyvinyltransferase [Candidatus Bipolaricaulota bacterium]
MLERDEGTVRITGIGPLSGKVGIPGDKSISHRGLLLGALAEGETRIRNLAPGDDVRSTMSCLRQLGVDVPKEGEVIVVKGKGPDGLEQPEEPLDAGNSGTLTRLITGILATRS